MIEGFFWVPPKQNIINDICKDFTIITALNLLQVLPLSPLFFLKSSLWELFSSLGGNNLDLEGAYPVRMQ